MRNFQVNPLDYSDYATNCLYDGERVYRVTFGNISEAYAIREEGESIEDFVSEVHFQLRKKYGKGFDIEAEDVTDDFGSAKGCQVNDSSALADILGIYCDYSELDEEAQDAIEEIFDELTIFDESDCNRYWNTSISEDETYAIIEKYADLIWNADGTLSMAS